MFSFGINSRFTVYFTVNISLWKSSFIEKQAEVNSYIHRQKDTFIKHSPLEKRDARSVNTTFRHELGDIDAASVNQSDSSILDTWHGSTNQITVFFARVMYQPIRSQYSLHVSCINQSDHSILNTFHGLSNQIPLFLTQILQTNLILLRSQKRFTKNTRYFPSLTSYVF